MQIIITFPLRESVTVAQRGFLSSMHVITPINAKVQEQFKILAIEDDEDNLMYLSSALSLFNYDCLAANNAVSGLSLAKAEQPSLILLDVRMPEISGFELVKILKIDLLTKDIPVVAITGLAREGGKQSILDAGFDDYLLKPYLLEDLENIISFHITPNVD